MLGLLFLFEFWACNSWIREAIVPTCWKFATPPLLNPIAFIISFSRKSILFYNYSWKKKKKKKKKTNFIYFIVGREIYKNNRKDINFFII